MKINLLIEFEKHYTGNVRDTMKICEQIAIENNLDVDYVADYIYINRYEKEESLEPEFV
jgi:hypothetical protein